MNELTPAADLMPTAPELTQQQKAAVVIGILGLDDAGGVLELMDEQSLRSFARAMSGIKRIEPEDVERVIQEFLHELDLSEKIVRGGLTRARGMLEQVVNNQTLSRIMDEVDSPSIHNVWKRLANVDDNALAEFLRREHPQTAAVVISKLGPEQAARLISQMEPDRARDIVIGITKASTLDSAVIEAIGDSVSKDFLATQRGDASKHKPADKVGSIMNYASTEIRGHVLSSLDTQMPEFADNVRRLMFTFEDIPDRIDRRDVSTIVRAIEQDVLLNALAGASENAPRSREHILSGISSRVAEQIEEQLSELGKVRKRDWEEAQSDVVKTIRQLESAGELTMIALEED